MDAKSLSDLPTDILINIFSYLDVKTIGRLACLCKKFREAANEDTVWKNNAKNCLVANMTNMNMINKSKPWLIPYQSRVKLSKMWMCYFFGVPSNVTRFEKCMPYISLERDFLYISNRASIAKYARDKNGDAGFEPLHEVNLKCDDISKFVVKENEIVCGTRDGKIHVLNKCGLENLQSIKAHHKDILSIDADQDTVISGSKDQYIKIWKSNNSELTCQQMINMKIRILSICILPSEGKFLVGTPGTREIPSLQLFDIEKGTYLATFGMGPYNGDGILDVFAESNNTFLSCGYDSFINVWDVRCPNNSVTSWVEPFDNTLYCVRSDFNNTIISGSSMNGAYLIIDKRRTQKYNRLMTYNCPKLASTNNRRPLTNYSGPVYCLEFDASHLYLGYDKTVFQFSYMPALDPNNAWTPSSNLLPKSWYDFGRNDSPSDYHKSPPFCPPLYPF